MNWIGCFSVLPFLTFLTFFLRLPNSSVDASGLSLTQCDDVCGVAKMPTFQDDKKKPSSKMHSIIKMLNDLIVVSTVIF
jgi:hypothetical protein